MSLLLSAFLTLILIIISGYFSMSEMALINARRSMLQKEVDEGSKKAEKAMVLASDSDRLLATIQAAITLVSFGAAALAASSFAAPIAQWLSGFRVGWLTAIAPAVSLIFTTLVVAYITLLFGELVPKRLALSRAESVAKSVAGPISVLQNLASPVISFLALSTNAVSKIFGIKGSEDRQTVSEEEIKYLVTEQDSLLDEEKRLIHEVFDLGDTVAREVMTPRVDMIAIEYDTSISQALSRMRGTGLSRLPVFHESPDRIVGIVMLKDLLAPMIDDRDDEPATAYMRHALFVPETKDILPLLREMQAEQQQIAIVIDEHGGTAGIVTVEDIVEEIFGEITDEFDPDHKYHTQLSKNEWLIDGRLSTDDAISLGFPVEDNDDYETIAGWLLDTIDTMPSVGDSFAIGEWVFKVQSMRRHRISLLRVTHAPATSTPEQETPVAL